MLALVSEGPELESHSENLLALWPWISYLSLGLQFPAYKTGVKIMTLSGCWAEADESVYIKQWAWAPWNNTCCHLTYSPNAHLCVSTLGITMIQMIRGDGFSIMGDAKGVIFRKWRKRSPLAPLKSLHIDRLCPSPGQKRLTRVPPLEHPSPSSSLTSYTSSQTEAGQGQFPCCPVSQPQHSGSRPAPPNLLHPSCCRHCLRGQMWWPQLNWLETHRQLLSPSTPGTPVINT